MSDDSEIKIVISADGSTAVTALKDVQNAAKGMAEDAESSGSKSEVAFKGVGIVAKSLAHEVGLTGGAARLLSHEVVDLARDLGGGAIALGIVGVATVATIKIYEHFAEAAQRKREELDKSVQSLEGEVGALYRNEGANDAVTRANYRLLEAQRAMLNFELDKKIATDTEELKKQEAALANMPSVLAIAYDDMGRAQEEFGVEETAEAKKSAQFNLNVLKEKLSKEQELKKQFATDVSYGSYSGEDEARRKAVEALRQQNVDIWNAQLERMKRSSAYHDKLIAEEQGNQDKITEIIRSGEEERSMIGLKGDDMMFARQAIADEKEIRELQKLSASENQINQIRTMQRIKWDLLVIETEKKNAKELTDYKQKKNQETLDHTENAFRMMADIGGTYGEAAFRAYQVAAIGRTIMTTRSAAMAAFEPPPVGLGPSAGWALAAAIVAEGTASVATIIAQKYSGGSGSTGSLSSSASSSSSSSSSSGSGYKYYSYESSAHGTGWKPGDTSAGVTVNVYGDVNDANKFQEKVAAAVNKSIRYGTDGVKSTVQRYT